VIEKAITVDENESCHFPDFEPLQTKNKCVVLKHLGEESLDGMKNNHMLQNCGRGKSNK
jgi:hypothetical protein